MNANDICKFWKPNPSFKDKNISHLGFKGKAFH